MQGTPARDSHLAGRGGAVETKSRLRTMQCSENFTSSQKDVHIANATARRCLCKWRRRPIAGDGGWSGLSEWNTVTHARFDALRAIANLDLVEVQSGRLKVLLPLLGWTLCMRGLLGVDLLYHRRIRGHSNRSVPEISSAECLSISRGNLRTPTFRYERVRAIVVAAAIG